LKLKIGYDDEEDQNAGDDEQMDVEGTSAVGQ
jgi:hypothetical protein